MVAITGVFIAYDSIQQDKASTDKIISAGQIGDKNVQNAIDKVDQKQTALLELALTDFQPEILYRIDFVNRENEPAKSM